MTVAPDRLQSWSAWRGHDRAYQVPASAGRLSRSLKVLLSRN
jgi:hypothetical protein